MIAKDAFQGYPCVCTSTNFDWRPIWVSHVACQGSLEFDNGSLTAMVYECHPYLGVSAHSIIPRLEYSISTRQRCRSKFFLRFISNEQSMSTITSDELQARWSNPRRLPLGTFQGLASAHFRPSTLSAGDGRESYGGARPRASWEALDPILWSDESSAWNGTAVEMLQGRQLRLLRRVGLRHRVSK